MTKQDSHVPSVAIITRTKNRPQFLERAIKSVLSQTYDDFIHVILNDGGDKAEVEQITSRNPDSRRLVIHNKQSVGLARALNQAIQASRSTHISILDDDDAWHQDRLKLGMETTNYRDALATTVPMEIVVEDINEKGEISEVDRMPHPESWSGELSLFKQAHKNYLSNGAIMYKRSVYDELNGYDEDLLTAEDWDFGIRLLMKCNVEQVISDEALVYYHQRPTVKDTNIGNSVHAGVREQERTTMMLRNNYLRKDFQKGVFGIGYIMNHSEQELINLVRLEGHVNRSNATSEEKIITRVHEDIQRVLHSKQLYQKIKRKISKTFRSN